MLLRTYRGWKQAPQASTARKHAKQARQAISTYLYEMHPQTIAYTLRYAISGETSDHMHSES